MYYVLLHEVFLACTVLVQDARFRLLDGPTGCFLGINTLSRRLTHKSQNKNQLSLWLLWSVEKLFEHLFVIVDQGWGKWCQSLYLTRRYGPLRGPTSSSCRGLRPRLFFALRAKKRELIMLFWPIFWQFWVASSNIGNF